MTDSSTAGRLDRVRAQAQERLVERTKRSMNEFAQPVNARTLTRQEQLALHQQRVGTWRPEQWRSYMEQLGGLSGIKGVESKPGLVAYLDAMGRLAERPEEPTPAPWEVRE